MGMTSKARILSVGTTLAADLVTDGNAEAVGMGSWPSIGTPTTAEKNTTTPIAGTKDIHILTDGTPYTFQGVYQSFAGTYGPGHIFKISWKHRMVQGSFRVSIAHGGAGVVWNSVYNVDDEYAYPNGRDINEYHEQYWVSGEDGDVDVWLVGYGAGVNEFYVDDIKVEEVTAAGMVAGNEGYFTQVTTPTFIPAQITAGSGTGVTVHNNGSLGDGKYKVTVDYTNCIAAAVNCDLTIATLPAKTFVQRVLGDLTVPYVCAGTCTTATLTGTLGRTAGASEFLASFDADAAAALFGDADAELGTEMNAAARVANGALIPGVLGSWTATTTVVYRLHSATGNLGTGTASNLNAGSVTFYLETSRMP